MKKMTSAQELRYQKDIYNDDLKIKIVNNLRDDFNVIYSHSQVILSLTTICLTITGFSGPKIAASSFLASFTMILGLVFVLLSGIILFIGPINLQWITKAKGKDFDESISLFIKKRDARTVKYHFSVASLTMGLFFYVFSVISYLWNSIQI